MNKSKILGFLLLICSIMSGQIDLEINNGMTIETNGSISIEISGDLVENGSGYLKGIVTSGSRTNETSFAGLTLSSGLTGTITRTTGTAFSASNPQSSLRSYKLENTGSALSTNVTSSFLSSGTNNERNANDDLYIYTNISSIWKGYSDNGSNASLITASNVDIPASSTTNIVISEGVGIGAKVYPAGPYQGGATPLASNLTFPSASPFSDASRIASVPSEAIDWVMVELRTGTDVSTSVGKRAAFIDANGYLIDDDGSPGIGFPAIPASGYRMVIKHRNHLSVMSNPLISVDWKSVIAP